MIIIELYLNPATSSQLKVVLAMEEVDNSFAKGGASSSGGAPSPYGRLHIAWACLQYGGCVE
jgi:hypothetical protein